MGGLELFEAFACAQIGFVAAHHEGGEVIVRPSVKAARLSLRKSITPNKKAEAAKGKK